MSLGRRDLLQGGGVAVLAAALPRFAQAQSADGSASASPQGAARHTIRIGNGLVELAPDHIISTTIYNGQFPGPLLRFEEGEQVVVDIHNDTDTPEQLHWHGQTLPVDVDGASEEGTPFIPAHGMRRIAFTPGPAGLRFYRTHLTPGADLSGGQYGGQVGTVYIGSKNDPGRHDREVSRAGLRPRKRSGTTLHSARPTPPRLRTRVSTLSSRRVREDAAVTTVGPSTGVMARHQSAVHRAAGQALSTNPGQQQRRRTPGSSASSQFRNHQSGRQGDIWCDQGHHQHAPLFQVGGRLRGGRSGRHTFPLPSPGPHG